MRDLLEDALAHQDSGYGRAQKHAQRQLPKRFYTSAEPLAVTDGFAVALDGKATRTPGKVAVVLPTEALAEALAAEWRAQGAFIDPDTMPLVRLVNSAIEGGAAALPGLRAEMLKYMGNDLLFYRADAPRELVETQEAHWDKVLVALARHFGVTFVPTVGIVHQPQPQATLDKLARGLDETNLLAATALASITNLTGSGLLALAYWVRLSDADAIWAAAHVDENFNARVWAADPEAEARLAKRRREFDAAIRVVDMARG